MSSPLSSQRSRRRAPRPGCENKDENKACEEKSHSGKNQRPVPSDSELLTSMTRRLTQLEQRVKAQQRDIDSKAKRITDLEKQLIEAQVEKQEDDLAKTCRKLQKQVYEMERFLNDYGMIWVGNGGDSDDECKIHPGSSEEMWQPDASLAELFYVNFDLVLQNVQQLNLMAGEGESHVTSIPGGAKLSRQPCVPLRLFKNGMVMLDGPFRPYNHPTTQQYMQDLMDGYFPSELKERFPNGLVFEIYDWREEEFTVVRHGARFPGRGHAVGGSEETLKGISEDSYDPLLDMSRSQLPGRKLSVEQFVSKLPKSVVKEGKVIDVRSSIKAKLQGSAEGAGKCSAEIVETPALQALRERVESGGAGGSATDPEVATLRVKSEDAEKTFILKMFFSETIGQLRYYIDAHRASLCPPSYDIISLFPQRCHTDEAQTLKACGLTPNSALLLRPHPSKSSI